MTYSEDNYLSIEELQAFRRLPELKGLEGDAFLRRFSLILVESGLMEAEVPVCEKREDAICA